jgi:fumarate reductase flavoprotein subunit
MEKLKTDVVVMGSGGAGLGAAISAREAGAKVIVFEKRRVVGGISVRGMGIFAVESRLQREKNLPFTKDDAFKLFMERSDWKPSARLVRAYINKTASTIDWLENMGVEFELSDQYSFPTCVNQTGHLVKSPAVGTQPSAAAHMIKVMKEKAEEIGVEIRNETGIKKIEKKGKEYLVTAEHTDGNSLQVETKTVVIAAGGFSHNEEMLKNHGGGYTLNKDMWVNHDIPLTGEGIQMAWGLGADQDGMCPQFTSFIPGGTVIMIPEIIGLIGLIGWSLPYLWVNQDGERFMDEANGDTTHICNSIIRQKDKCSYIIIDSATANYLDENGPEITGYIHRKMGSIEEMVKVAIEKGADNIFMAESLGDLAKQLKIDPDALQKNVDEYNKCCENNYDALFAKDPRYLKPVKEPKFYAFKRRLGAYGTVGGIKINERAEVVDKDSEIIPGLYAAGDCANGIHTHHYSLVYIFWGSTLGFAINSGRIAGENAAKYIKSIGK